jgi:hypothetical protein
MDNKATNKNPTREEMLARAAELACPHTGVRLMDCDICRKEMLAIIDSIGKPL